jgi:hypothetical protein
MSDVMLIGVLRMPPETWADDPISVTQRYSRYQQAADRIEKQQKLLDTMDEILKSAFPDHEKLESIKRLLA